jgi:hypothetical protein
MLAIVAACLTALALGINYYFTDRAFWRKLILGIGVIGIMLGLLQAYLSRQRTTDLETQIAARSLDKAQFNALKSVEGKVSAANIMSADTLESSVLADEIMAALQEAHVTVQRYLSSGIKMTGIMILYPNLPKFNNFADFDQQLTKDPLCKAFKDAGLNPRWGNMKNVFPDMNIPRDVPMIFVGEKNMYFVTPPTFSTSSPTIQTN